MCILYITQPTNRWQQQSHLSYVLLFTLLLHSTSLKYSHPNVTDGSRLLLVCDVALGQCKEVHERDLTLTQAPEGHHSVHGLRRSSTTQSEFEVGGFA